MNGISYTDDASKAKILNEFFASQPTNTTIYLDKSELNQNIQGPELNSIPIQREKIIEILKSLNVSKACGIDGIGNNVLKKCADSLVEPISLLAGASLESGCFPAAWKQANVVPVYKKNDKTCVTNYRPISLLPCASKVVERLVYNELYDYCSKFNLLSEKNSGFKKLDGTINQLINLTNKIYQGLNDEHEIAMIFLDLSKAYDRICHTRLIYKLRKLGIKGTLLKWIESYLSERSQRVVYGGTTSDFIKIFGSVPQGSILSSLLFLIYLIDIEAGIKSDMFMFADDVALMNKFKNKNTLEFEMNADLKKLNDWAYTWNMDFNPAKTEMIVFSNKKVKSRPNIFLKEIKINQVATHKHLGIFLSENMKWTAHIDYSVNKARKKLGLLRRQSQSLSTKQKIDIYKIMIRPVLEYGSVLFDNCSVCDSIKIESCQSTAALICTGAMRRTETKLLLEYLGWDSLEDRRKIFKTSLFYKIIHNQTPSYLLRNITFKQPQTHALRNTQTINFPRCRLDAYKKSFFPSCIHIWNTLPDALTNAKNYTTFKKKIKHHLNLGKGETEINRLFYNSHDGFLGKILTQVKLNLSPLKFQLFKYNLTDNPFCPSCGDSVETPIHYFIECNTHRANRQIMIQNLLKLNPNLSTPSDFLEYILNGSISGTNELRDRTNKAIFRHVFIFMFKTQRFILNF